MNKITENRLSKLEENLKPNEIEPAEWAVQSTRTIFKLSASITGAVVSDSEVTEEALRLTRQHGTREAYTEYMANHPHTLSPELQKMLNEVVGNNAQKGDV